MAKKKNVLGAWAFLVGVILALIIGLLGVSGTWVVPTLLVLGIVIGLLNVGGAELKEFMLAGAVLVIISSLAGQLMLVQVSILNIGAVLQALVNLFVPATIVVALKVVLALARK